MFIYPKFVTQRDGEIVSKCYVFELLFFFGPMVDKMVEIRFEDLLVFITGADEVPVLGFRDNISIDFYDQAEGMQRLPYLHVVFVPAERSYRGERPAANALPGNRRLLGLRKGVEVRLSPFNNISNRSCTHQVLFPQVCCFIDCILNILQVLWAQVKLLRYSHCLFKTLTVCLQLVELYAVSCQASVEIVLAVRVISKNIVEGCCFLLTVG